MAKGQDRPFNGRHFTSEVILWVLRWYLAFPGSYRALVQWPLQEIRRVAARLAQRRIRPALILAWSAWRRAHQATAQRAHMKKQSATVMLGV